MALVVTMRVSASVERGYQETLGCVHGHRGVVGGSVLSCWMVLEMLAAGVVFDEERLGFLLPNGQAE